MTIRELRERAGMSRREFAEYFHISYRTVQDWELGCNKCKDYIIRAFITKCRRKAPCFSNGDIRRLLLLN